MDMALIHTVNAFSWPLLIIATTLGLWKLTTILTDRRSAAARYSQPIGAGTVAAPAAQGPRRAADISGV